MTGRRSKIVVASGNIRKGLTSQQQGSESPIVENVRSTAAVLKQSGASIVALNEAVRQPDGVDVVAEIGTQTGLRSLWDPTLRMSSDGSVREATNSGPLPTGWVEFGNALLLPEDARVVRTAGVPLPSLGAYIPEKSIGLHEPRRLLLAVVAMSNGFFGTVGITHLSPRRLGDDAIGRLTRSENALQLTSALQTFARGAFPKPWLLLGDLNVRHDQPLGSSRTTPVEQMASMGFTWVKTPPTHRKYEGATIDYQAYAPGVESESVGRPLLSNERSLLITDTPIGDHHLLVHTYETHRFVGSLSQPDR